ncbi:MAG: histidine--tRNA ligase [Nanoarchaeota archaeon]
MELQLAKGTRDILPEEMLWRNEILAKAVAVFARFGFLPLETPTLERFETLSSKYTGGAEILKETFQLKDQGKRDLGLRYDHTVPLARFVGMNSNLKMPFKRFAVGKVFRDGPIKLGRYREFWQLDVDIIGAKGMRADAELLSLTSQLFSELGCKPVIKVNNRKLLNGILEQVGIKDKEPAILSLDKLEKFGRETVFAELEQKGLSEQVIHSLFDFLTNDLEGLKTIITNEEGLQGIKELEELFGYLKQLKVKAEFEVSLARGLAYYTGTVFEVYLPESEVKSSVAAGGRYDTMIGKLLGSKLEWPAVGISFGLDVLADALPKREQKTTTKLFIIPIHTTEQCFALAHFFRNSGVNTDLDIVGRSISKNLDYANSQGIPFVLFVGEDELAQGRLKLRDMGSGKEELLAKEVILGRLT